MKEKGHEREIKCKKEETAAFIERGKERERHTE